MGVNLKIRSFQQSDFDALLNIDENPSDRRKHKLMAAEKLENIHCLVALNASEEPIGFLVFEDLGANSYYIIQINVRHRRRRIGSSLMIKLFEQLKDGHFSLCVNRDNEAAISFYEQLGFVWAGYTRNYRDKQDKFWYTKSNLD